MTQSPQTRTSRLDRIKEAANTAASLEEFFVRSSRHDEILTEILLVHEARKSAAGRKSLRETRGFAHIAPTGSGKTRTLDKVFSEIEASNGKTGAPGDRMIVSVRVRTPATLKTVGISILKALGYIDADRKRSASDGTFADIWEIIYRQLEQQGIEILHLDEAQDLYQNANSLQRASIINTLKTLTQNNQWPVCLVLSGTEDLEALLNDDQQLGRRFTVIGLDALNFASDRKMISKILAHYVKEAGFSLDIGDEKEFIQRLIVGSVGRLGIMIEVVIGAVKAAILDGATEVGMFHFAAAYRRRTDCDVGQNPFLAEEWRVIDASKVLARDENTKRLAPLTQSSSKKKRVEQD